VRELREFGRHLITAWRAVSGQQNTDHEERMRLHVAETVKRQDEDDAAIWRERQRVDQRQRDEEQQREFEARRADASRVLEETVKARGSWFPGDAPIGGGRPSRFRRSDRMRPRFSGRDE
jgi:hypothetical protein